MAAKEATRSSRRDGPEMVPPSPDSEVVDLRRLCIRIRCVHSFQGVVEGDVEESRTKDRSDKVNHTPSDCKSGVLLAPPESSDNAGSNAQQRRHEEQRQERRSDNHPIVPESICNAHYKWTTT